MKNDKRNIGGMVLMVLIVMGCEEYGDEFFADR